MSFCLCCSLYRAYRQGIDMEGAKIYECKSFLNQGAFILSNLVHTADHHSESEEEEHVESLFRPPLSTVSTMEIVEEDNQKNSLVCNVGSYEWLVEHFKSMQ